MSASVREPGTTAGIVPATGYDPTAAIAEGWRLVDRGDGVREIQRVDYPETFDSDYEALCFVRERAAGRSVPHIVALNLDGTRWRA